MASLDHTHIITTRQPRLSRPARAQARGSLDCRASEARTRGRVPQPGEWHSSGRLHGGSSRSAIIAPTPLRRMSGVQEYESTAQGSFGPWEHSLRRTAYVCDWTLDTRLEVNLINTGWHTTLSSAGPIAALWVSAREGLRASRDGRTWLVAG